MQHGRNQEDAQGSLAYPKISQKPSELPKNCDILRLNSIDSVAVKVFLPYELKPQKHFARFGI